MAKPQKKKRYTRYAMGKHCLLELLRHNPECIVRIITCREPSHTDPIFEKAFDLDLRIQEEDKATLSDRVGSESHQGYVAKLRERPNDDMQEVLEDSFDKPRSLILALDSIADPQNLGAILRAAECFGVEAVLWSTNRCVDLTPVVARASVGASELVKCVRVSNLAESLRHMQKNGYKVVVADANEDAASLTEFTFPERTVLVMGSEAKGVQPLILKRTDERVFIPMAGKISSLNVSQATACLLANWSLAK